MARKFFTFTLLFALISCGSSEFDSVTESIEPIENTTSTTSTTTTTKAQDSTTIKCKTAANETKEC